MFREFNLIHGTNRLIDTDFIVDGLLGGTYIETIIHEYQKRNLPVASNMARYYIWYHDRYVVGTTDRWYQMEHDMNYLNRTHPNWQYSTKYYPCVLNQIKMLQFGRRPR